MPVRSRFQEVGVRRIRLGPHDVSPPNDLAVPLDRQPRLHLHRLSKTQPRCELWKDPEPGATSRAVIAPTAGQTALDVA